MEPNLPSINPFAGQLQEARVSNFVVTKRSPPPEKELIDIRGAAEALGGVLRYARQKNEEEAQDELSEISGEISQLAVRQAAGEDVKDQLAELFETFTEDVEGIIGTSAARKRRKQLFGTALGQATGATLEARLNSTIENITETLIKAGPDGAVVDLSIDDLIKASTEPIEEAINGLRRSLGDNPNALRAFDATANQLRPGAYAKVLEQQRRLQDQFTQDQGSINIGAMARNFRDTRTSGSEPQMEGARAILSSGLQGAYGEYMAMSNNDVPTARGMWADSVLNAAAQMDYDDGLLFMTEVLQMELDGVKVSDIELTFKAPVFTNAMRNMENQAYAEEKKGLDSASQDMADGKAWAQSTTLTDEFLAAAGDPNAIADVVQGALQELSEMDDVSGEYKTAAARELQGLSQTYNGLTSSAQGALEQAEQLVADGLTVSDQLKGELNATDRAKINQAEAMYGAQAAALAQSGDAFVTHDESIRAQQQDILAELATELGPEEAEAFAREMRTIETSMYEGLTQLAVSTDGGMTRGVTTLPQEDVADFYDKGPRVARNNAISAARERVREARQRNEALVKELESGERTDVPAGLSDDVTARMTAIVTERKERLRDDVARTTTDDTYLESYREGLKTLPRSVPTQTRRQAERDLQDGLNKHLTRLMEAGQFDGLSKKDAWVAMDHAAKDFVNEKLERLMPRDAAMRMEVLPQRSDALETKRQNHPAFAGPDEAPDWSTSDEFDDFLESQGAQTANNSLLSIAPALGFSAWREKDEQTAHPERYFGGFSRMFLTNNPELGYQGLTVIATFSQRAMAHLGIRELQEGEEFSPLTLSEREAADAMAQAFIDNASSHRRTNVREWILAGNLGALSLDDYNVPYEVAPLFRSGESARNFLIADFDEEGMTVLSKDGKQFIQNLNKRDWVDDPTYWLPIVDILVSNAQAK